MSRNDAVLDKINEIREIVESNQLGLIFIAVNLNII